MPESQLLVVAFLARQLHYQSGSRRFAKSMQLHKKAREGLMLGRTTPLSQRCNDSGREKSQAGFTLLELLVVIAIIGMLTAYVGPKYFSQLGKSEQAVAKSQVEAFSRALGTYRLDVGRFPTTEEGLAALVARPEGTVKWNGPYLDRAVPVDPWGRPYIYWSPGAHGDFDIASLGKDGQAGGVADAADVTNY